MKASMLLIVLGLTTVTGTNAPTPTPSCQWTGSYATGTGSLACQSLSEDYVKMSWECTNTIFGKCTSYKYCCALLSGGCGLFDLNCNAAQWINAVDNLTTELQDKFDTLVEATREKMLTAFDKLSQAELNVIPDDLLCKLKTLSSITADQFLAIKTRLSANMTVLQLKDFLTNVNKTLVETQLAVLGDQMWDHDHAKAVLDELKARGVAMRGTAKAWTKEQITNLKHLAAGFNATDLDDIKAMLPKLDLPALRSLLADVQPAAIKANIAKLGQEVWDESHAKAVLDQLRSKVDFNMSAISSWNAMHIETLKGLLKGLNMTDLKQISIATFNATAAVLRENAADTKEKLQALAVKAEETWGAVKDWKQEQMDKAGKMIMGLSNITLPTVNLQLVLAMNNQTFMDIDFTLDPNVLLTLISKIGEMAADWGEKGAKLIEDLKNSALYGAIENWKQDQMDKLGALVDKIKAVDLSKIAADVWAKTVATAKMSAAKLGDLIVAGKEWTRAQFKEMLTHINATKAFVHMLVMKVGEGAELVQERAQDLLMKVQEVAGEIKTWTADQVGQLGKLIRMVNITDLKAAAETVISDIKVIAQLAGAQVLELKYKLGAHLKVLVARLPWAELEKILGQLRAGVRWSIEAVAALKDRLVVQWGAVETWTEANILKIKNFLGPLVRDAIKAGAEIPAKLKLVIGDIIKSAGLWADANLEALANAVKTTFGPVAQWTQAQIELFGPVLSKLGTDLEALKNETIKLAVQALGVGFQYSKAQAMVLGAKIRAAYGAAANWTKTEIEKLGVLAAAVCDKIDIAGWSKAAFEGAVEFLGKVKGWTQEQLKALAAKAKEVYGDVKNWTKAQILALGEIIQGLDLPDLPRLPSFSGSFSITVTHGMDKTLAASLSLDHLKDAGAALNGDQLSSMTQAQLAASICQKDSCNAVIVDKTIGFEDTPEHFLAFTKSVIETKVCGSATNCTVSSLLVDLRSEFEKAEGLAGSFQANIRAFLGANQTAATVAANAENELAVNTVIGEGVMVTSKQTATVTTVAYTASDVAPTAAATAPSAGGEGRVNGCGALVPSSFLMAVLAAAAL